MRLDIEYRLKGKDEFLHTELGNEDLKVEILESGDRHIVKVTALKSLTLIRGKINEVHTFEPNDVFPTNGYQSWTDTKERVFKEKEKERNIFKLPKALVNAYSFDKYGDAVFYPYKPNTVHGYDIFYVKGNKEIFSYNYNFHNAYLIFEVHYATKSLDVLSDIYGVDLKKGESFQVYDMYFGNNYEKGLENFKKDFALLRGNKVFGYTSWYNYYQNINESIILRDLDSLDSRFGLFQIDDGYETFVGDWLNVDKKKFPNGLKEIVDKIHKKGFKAGIWLAPFVAETKSKLFNEHIDWFKRDEKGELAKCGSNWSGFYALDLDKEEVKDYIKKCLKHYIDLGFDFFKLDFLYASSIAPTPGKSRAMITTEAYQMLRDILKDKIILGCGANCFSSYKMFDYLRVGPDVSLKFDDIWYMKFMHRERISTKVTLQNTIYRSIFNNRLFLNDPDVFLLRKENIQMNDKQKEALLTINALFGSVLMTSDNIATYDDKTKALLENKLQLFYHAHNVSYKKRGHKIDIKYQLEDKEYKITYNTKKGTLS